MDKIRVHELAKKLNTTSKKLIEKLSEINIKVKSHMSLLSEEELDKLYDHIGIVRRDKSKQSEDDNAKSESNKRIADVSINKKKIHRIIRKTEIIIKDEEMLQPRSKKKEKKRRRDYVRVASSTDGLMAGLVRGQDETITKIRKRTGEQPNKEKLVSKEKDEIKKETTGKEHLKKSVTIRKVIGDDTGITGIKKVIPKSKQLQKDALSDDGKATVIESDSKKFEPLKKENTKVDGTDSVKGKAIDAQKTERLGEGIVTAKQGKEDEKKNFKDEQDSAKKEGAKVPKTDSKQKETIPKKKRQKQDGTLNKTADNQKSKKEFGMGKDGKKRYKNETKGNNKGFSARKREGKPLVIPKPSIAPGQPEEKTQQRGERRNFIGKEYAKKEIKKEKIERIQRVQSNNKSNKYKKKLDFIGEKQSVDAIMSDDFIIERFYKDDDMHLRKKDKALKLKAKKEKQIPHKAVLTDITIPESITVKRFAETLKKTASEVIKKLMSMGIMATLNQELDFDTAAIIADEFGIRAHKEVVESIEEKLFDETEDKEENMVERAPVVVVMGHVDHGKTSLLDVIRKANIAESEAGGITQHIGAYIVSLNGRNITFLDTPGHEAFTSMRARGAKVTDIAVLVVAADDGVMPQTIEAINHAKAAGISIIVAINKIDKPNANPEKVKQELAEHGLLIEDWGGDIIAIPVSAKTKTNIDQLLEMILLTADMLELKANPNKQAKGTIIEAQLDKSRGPIATLLVQRGTLKKGDALVSGTTFGRVRMMHNDKGESVKEAGPSTPVVISGFSEVPEAGETFYVVKDEKLAKQLIEERKEKMRSEKMKVKSKITLDDLFNQIQKGNIKGLNIIVKADVQGSVEAVKNSLEKLSNEEVNVNIIHGAVGAITESDVKLAEVSNAIIIGFNVRPPANVIDAAKNAGVDMRLYRVIYEAIEDIEKAMKGLLEPTFEEVVDGHIEIRQTFKASSLGTIGGGYVLDGKVLRSSNIRVIRDGIVIYEGKLASLKRFKDDVKEVQQGYECGLLVERFNDIKEGDIIEAYHMEEIEK